MKLVKKIDKYLYRLKNRKVYYKYPHLENSLIVKKKKVKFIEPPSIRQSDSKKNIRQLFKRKKIFEKYENHII